MPTEELLFLERKNGFLLESNKQESGQLWLYPTMHCDVGVRFKLSKS